MAKYTAYNLIRAVSLLPRNTNYNYINPRTPGLIHIAVSYTHLTLPTT